MYGGPYIYMYILYIGRYIERDIHQKANGASRTYMSYYRYAGHHAIQTKFTGPRVYVNQTDLQHRAVFTVLVDHSPSAGS